MSADFTPVLNEKNELGAFRFWCQKVLPLTYDDSLSYYELLCKVVKILNDTIENQDKVGEDIRNLYNAFVSLQKYTNEYFNNLDIQKEINDKLDEMVENGELDVIISKFFNYYVTPQMYGGVGDGVNDDSLSIQQCINSGKLIIIPSGKYICKNVTLKSNTKIIGTNNSFLSCGESLDSVFLITETLTEFVTIKNITFEGNGYAIKGEYPNYLSTAIIENCDFRKSLYCCISCNMILSTVKNCLFGYYGSYNPYNIHKHIEVITETSGNQATDLKFENNRFYSANDEYSCYFKNVLCVTFLHNNIEGNMCNNSLSFDSCIKVIIDDNWFERNECECDIKLEGGSVYDNYIVDITRNYFYCNNIEDSIIKCVNTGKTPTFTYNFVYAFNNYLINFNGNKNNIFNTFVNNKIYNGVGEFNDQYGGFIIPKTELMLTNLINTSELINGIFNESYMTKIGDFSVTPNDEINNGYKGLILGGNTNAIHGLSIKVPSFLIPTIAGKKIIISAIGKEINTDYVDHYTLGVKINSDGYSRLRGSITYTNLQYIQTEYQLPNELTELEICLITGGTSSTCLLLNIGFNIKYSENNKITM